LEFLLGGGKFGFFFTQKAQDVCWEVVWGQDIKVFTDHKNLASDALGLTSDRVYRWQLISEEHAPKITYIKGIHNTVTDAISQLDYDPKLNTTNNYTHACVASGPHSTINHDIRL
jgi:hypothetical protein